MEPKLDLIPLILLIIISSIFFSPTILSSDHNRKDINYWCQQTPNPDTCKYFLSQKISSALNSFNSAGAGVPKQKSEFRKMAIELALEKARHADSHTKGLGKQRGSQKEKVAWADCSILYQETILKLNQTFDKCSDFDAQTWLSTALTNLETCLAGLLELGVAHDHSLPLMSNNVTKLVSNALALGNMNGALHTNNKLPSWVKPGDMKLLQAARVMTDVVVAKDGSGNYRTVGQAVKAAASRKGSGRFVIRVKAGVYKENVEIGSKLKNIMLVGDGMSNTIITGSRSVAGGSTTFNSATVAAVGDRFIARDITFRNTAGPQNHQAVALRSGSDLSAFYRCGFQGYQDTLYVHSQRQFYKECSIYGTVDFIFGNAAVVLQNCQIYARRPMAKQKITITAQGRTDPNQNTGISIHNSRVMAASDLRPVLSSFRTFLGRPWKQYSRTVFMQTNLDSLVDSLGWLEWDGDFALSTLYYGEYRNTGPGASTGGRVKWSGFRVITGATKASRFTVGNFIGGDSWLPHTRIPFTSGL